MYLHPDRIERVRLLIQVWRNTSQIINSSINVAVTLESIVNASIAEVPATFFETAAFHLLLFVALNEPATITKRRK
jgi:hypothetical protein